MTKRDGLLSALQPFMNNLVEVEQTGSQKDNKWDDFTLSKDVWKSILCKNTDCIRIEKRSTQCRHVHLSVYLVSIDNFVAP